MEITVYGCGGAGVNIVSGIRNRKSHEGLAKIKSVYIDTSRSNIGSNIASESIFLVDGLDGSGKKRDMNYNPIKDSVNNILLQHKPSDMNVVVHSASGGSGSVLSPVLVSELLARGEQVIVLLVGSTGSLIETENTLKTLKSYESISKIRERPVIVYYRENSKDKNRSAVDSEMTSVIAMFSVLFSGDNRELDSADTRNWLDFQKVTSFSPKLSSLEICTNQITLNKNEALVSVVTVTNDKMSGDVDGHVEYHAVGYVPESIQKEVVVEYPIHFCIISGAINTTVAALESKISKYKEHRAAIVEKSIVKGNESHTSDGLIF